MLSVTMDEILGLALLEPHGALTQQDFESASVEISEYLNRGKTLHGIVIHTRDFPGWDSFGAMSAHFKFVQAQQAKIARLALVTDSVLGNMAELMMAHFVSAEVKAFAFDDLDAARLWAGQMVA